MPPDACSSIYVGAFGNRSGSRSRTGCHTCRQKKVKCDETRPICRRCARLSRPCVWPWRNMPLGQPGNENTTQRDQDYRVSTASPPSMDAFPSYQNQDCANWRPCTLLPASHYSPSGLWLGQKDHEAIFFYRTIFVSLHDTKNPIYSVPSIIFQLGASSALIMHSVLAIGKQYMAILTDANGHGHLRTEALRHYCEAILFLRQTITASLSPSDLSRVLAAVWLMLTYEESFGDDVSGSSLCKHFRGVTSIIEANLTCLLNMLNSGNAHHISPDLSGNQVEGLSYLTSRVLVRLTVLDARASSFGLGGQLNQSLAELMGMSGPRQTEISWFHFLSGIYEQSAPVFQTTWGIEYPPSEMEYDAENESAFQLYRHCSTLRLMVAQIRRGGVERPSLVSEATQMIKALREQYEEIFSIAERLPLPLNEVDERFLMTLCWVVPQYYGSVLDLSDAIAMELCVERKADASFNILKLANYAWKKDGMNAIARVAWPLFMVMQETKDSIHQDWIVDRFEQLSSYGKPYRKATRWLKSRMGNEAQVASNNQFEDFFL